MQKNWIQMGIGIIGCMTGVPLARPYGDLYPYRYFVALLIGLNK